MFFEIFVKGFLEEFKYTLIFYVLIIIVFFPFEAVVLPKFYGNLFDTIKGNLSNVSLFDFAKNIKLQNFQGALISVIAAWGIIIASFGVKHHLESILMPEFMSHIRKKLYDMTVNLFPTNVSSPILIPSDLSLHSRYEVLKKSGDLLFPIVVFFPKHI